PISIIDLVDQRMDFPVPLLSSSSSANRRLRGILDAGAGSFAKRTCPHFRHVLARSSSFGSASQHGAFPLRTAFWVRSASSFQDDDPRPFALISFKSTAPDPTPGTASAGISLTLISVPTVRWLQAGLCVSRCSPFRLRASHYSSHTFPLDDTRPP